METTNRRFASMSSLFAISARSCPCIIVWAARRSSRAVARASVSISPMWAFTILISFSTFFRYSFLLRSALRSSRPSCCSSGRILSTVSHHCHQVPFLARREFESPDELRQLDSPTAEVPTGTSKRRLFRLRSHSAQFHAKRIYLFIRRADLADNVQAFLELLFNFVVGQFLIAKPQNVFDDVGIFFQLVSQRDDFADDDRRPRQRLQYRTVAALDTFGDHDFSGAGKQRNRSHLAEINPDGIAVFLKSAGREVQFNLAFGNLLKFLFTWNVVQPSNTLICGIDDFDARRTERGNQIIQIF